MDPHSFIARAEAQRWIGIAEKLLMGHDLVGSKTFAIRARESDPRLEAADQILAIADTLLAAEKLVVGNNGAQQPDFYAVLQLVRFVQDTDHIASQYRRLAVILNPHHNRFPYSDQAFQLVNDAWAVLSNPLRKSMYDAELDLPNQQQQMNHIGFNLEQHQQQQHQHQHHHHQQHNFFSLNHMAGSGHEQELAEPPQQHTFEARVQQQHNFLSQPNPVRSPPLPVREHEHLFQQRNQEHLFQPQVQPFQITSTPLQQTRLSPQPQPPQPRPPMRQPTPPAPAPPQPPLSWPQPQPPLAQPQPQPQLQPWQQQKPQAPPPPPPQPQAPLPPPQAPTPLPPLQPLQPQVVHQEQEQEPLEQNATLVQLPSQVNSNNDVREEEIESEPEAASEDVDDSPTFWTACPYCFYMYEYPRVYADCTLRCDNCKRAFQAVQVPSPPPIIQGQKAYFCCWGSFPLGVSISHLEKNNGNNSNWTPFSPFHDVSRNVEVNLDDSMPKGNLDDDVPNKSRSLGSRIYIDDVTDDIFTGVSEPSDDSDVEWGSTRKKKGKRMKKDKGKKRRAKGSSSVRAKDTRTRTGKNLQNSDAMQEDEDEDEEVSTAPLAESSKKPVASNPRRQSGRVAKELGKLDLNVEFNNNEGEEPAARMAAGNRGHEHGEEENIEGIGFFEGLDEFLSSLPILSVVNDEKGKAA